jgi:hypothetical protein
MEQFEKEITMYNGKVFGVNVSEYGLKNGYLDYQTLSKIVGDSVLNNSIMPYTGFDEWELVNGYEENEEGWYEVYQYYIISDYGFRILEDYTDEIVYYHQDLDMYVWGITHFGTSWDYVLTDIKLVGDDQ